MTATACIGLTDRWELRLGWSGLADVTVDHSAGSDSFDGIADADLGLKLGLSENPTSGLKTALLVTTTVPIGDDELTSDRFDPEIRYIAGRDLSETVSFGVNVGPRSAASTLRSTLGEFELCRPWGRHGRRRRLRHLWH